MSYFANLKKTISKFRSYHGITDENDDNIAAVMHVYNAEGTDIRSAIDQSSNSKNDHGIDAWIYDSKEGILKIFQSKLSEDKKYVLENGTSDLIRAAEFVCELIIKEKLDHVPDNRAIYNLLSDVIKIKQNLKSVHLILLSTYAEEDFGTAKEYETVQNYKQLVMKSKLNKFMQSQGDVKAQIVKYGQEQQKIPGKEKEYTLQRFRGSRITIGEKINLSISYYPLIDLVRMYLQSHEMVFYKNVRLPVTHLKKNKEILHNPMKETLEDICSGKLPPEIFTFYHGGVTISSENIDLEDDENELIAMTKPNIINGCQTTTIASKYYEGLVAKGETDKIKVFEKIKVIVKTVSGMEDEFLKQMTNNNNRQAKIEPWQLYANDSFHIRLKDILRDRYGVFYERQAGDFEVTMQRAKSHEAYRNTNKTFLGIYKLGQILAVMNKEFEFAGHPERIFSNQARHDQIFNQSLLDDPELGFKLIFLFNIYRSAVTGLLLYFKDDTKKEKYKNVASPTYKAIAHFIAIQYLLSKRSYQYLIQDYSHAFNQKATGSINKVFWDEIYPKIIPKLSATLENFKSKKGQVSKSNTKEVIKSLFEQFNINETGLGQIKVFSKKITEPAQ